MQHLGKMLSDIVLSDSKISETGSALELNFIIGKKKSNPHNDLDDMQ